MSNRIWLKMVTICYAEHFAVWISCYLFYSIQSPLSGCKLHKYSPPSYCSKVTIHFSQIAMHFKIFFFRILDNDDNFNRSNVLWKYNLDLGTKQWKRKTRIMMHVYKDFINKRIAQKIPQDYVFRINCCANWILLQ